ncbi:anti-sigma factor [Edaphobacter sp. 12200R-103]|jgi:anti-sigma factor RsiW|uniref:anti-sigma factor family protein n=1 Tax=Edaphobacter sp. 12200R-103 TaxID=2703788 RepID=UPI00138C099B|nr:zf-HC2 domain-containing protein [Edaphobacter sp. 12200R-103]QHS50813.1 zf-HC2 domain-containing protein [Edaphobacter sp. 12200R-103]
MNCTDFLSQLTDYFDGQISPELLEEVRAHLAGCSHCEVVLNTTRRTIEVYRDNEIYDISDELQEKLHSAIMARCLEKKRA